MNKRVTITNPLLKPVLRIWIRMFFGLLDPDSDPLVRGTDPEPSTYDKTSSTHLHYGTVAGTHRVIFFSSTPIKIVAEDASEPDPSIIKQK